MKKLITLLTILFLPVLLLAQNPLQGFLYPVTENPVVVQSKTRQFTADTKIQFRADSSYNIGLIRYTMGVSGTEILYNKATKEFSSNVYAKVGVGLSYSFYRVNNGEAFNYLSINALAFLPITDNNKTFSVAVTASAFNLLGTNLSPQIGVNFEPARIKSDIIPVGLLVGLQYDF